MLMGDKRLRVTERTGTGVLTEPQKKVVLKSISETDGAKDNPSVMTDLELLTKGDVWFTSVSSELNILEDITMECPNAGVTGDAFWAAESDNVVMNGWEFEQLAEVEAPGYLAWESEGDWCKLLWKLFVLDTLG